MTKVALLIGVSEYESEYESGLNRLPAAVRDIEAMQGVLQHSEFGAFDEIKRLPNPGLLEMRNAIYELFGDRNSDDLVLLYFSGHGVTDEYGKFFFTNRQTQKKGSLNKATVVEAEFVHNLMENCDSERQVIILDCCHSGAFPEGMRARDAGTIDFQQQLGGRGRIILTSSAATEYSFERDGEELAIYTRYLVEGIQTGAADLDGDGAVSVNELHDYVKAKVKKAAPAMQPERYVFQDGEKILLAKAPVTDPQRNYRKEVQKRIKNGKLSGLAIRTLREIAHRLGLSIADAETIEVSELKPYQELQQKLDHYREAFLEAVQIESPISEATCLELQDYQQILGLQDEDVRPIESTILSDLSVVSEWDQIEAFLNWKIEAIAPVETPKAPSTPSPSPTLATFEFDVVTIEFQTSDLLGRNTELVKRSRPASAEYLREALGNSGFLDMVSIPGGTFEMVSEEDDREKPIHSVTVQPFYIGKFVVTQAQWKVVAALPKINHDLNPDPSNFKGENRPVEQISWFEAIEFCDRLSQKTGKPYRLPSEAEWEYACRAGTTTLFHFGKTISTDLANYNGNYTYGPGKEGQYREQTTDVGSFSPNAFGLYDMHGNVWEWCGDRWHDNYDCAPSNGSIWEAGSSKYRLLRGGSYLSNPRDCRSTNRYRGLPDYGYGPLGFRVTCLFPRIL
ncbi:caspase, EACC1-associated type [Phormidesmis priestleyi]